MKNRIVIGVGAVVAIGLVYFTFFSGESVEPTITVELPTAAIGEGEDAVAVSPQGVVLVDQPAPKEGMLPRLPTIELPKSGQLGGAMLQQARILGAAPEPLRACISRSYFGETGVVVELDSGIELLFGDATRASEKWASAVTVFADPSITALDYVDLHSPGRPATYGSGHSLPSPAEGSVGGCGA